MVSIQVILEKVSLVVLPRETFYSLTYIAMEYMVSIQVLLEKVSVIVLIVHPEEPFTVGLV